MKAVLLSFFVILLYSEALAQTNYHKLGIGGGGGFTQSFTDVSSHDFAPAIYGTLDYFLTPFLSLGGELQMGKVKANAAPDDAGKRMFTNSYKAASVNGKVALGALLDDQQGAFLNAIRWMYIGAGGGVIHHNMVKIRRVDPRTADKFPGKDHSNELMIPLNAGFSYYFSDAYGKPKFGINVNFQKCITLGEGLDGYDDSAINFESGSPDNYNFFSIGLRYQFGPVSVSRKSL